MPLQLRRLYRRASRGSPPRTSSRPTTSATTIKHLGISKRTDEGFELRVHPTLIPNGAAAANVHGVKNANRSDGRCVGRRSTTASGRRCRADRLGGGRRPARRGPWISPPLTITGCPTWPSAASPMSRTTCRCCPWKTSSPLTTCGLLAVDRPGVLARVATISPSRAFSIEAIIQKEATEGELVPNHSADSRTREKKHETMRSASSSRWPMSRPADAYSGREPRTSGMISATGHGLRAVSAGARSQGSQPRCPRSEPMRLYQYPRAGARLSFDGCRVTGMASDGGLYVPEQIPQLSRDAWGDGRALLCRDRLSGDEPFVNGEIDERDVFAASSPRPMPPSSHDAVVPLNQLRRQPLPARAVPRPDAGLQGRRPALLGPLLDTSSASAAKRAVIMGCQPP